MLKAMEVSGGDKKTEKSSGRHFTRRQKTMKTKEAGFPAKMTKAKVGSSES